MLAILPGYLFLSEPDRSWVKKVRQAHGTWDMRVIDMFLQGRS